MKGKLFVAVLSMSLLTSCGTNSENPDAIEREDIDQTIIDANNKLGFDLLKTVDLNSDGNVFVSPTSLFMALSMVYNGADGVTKQEVAEVLHLSDMETEQLNQANEQLMLLLNDEDRGVELDVGNSIWLNDQYNFQDKFLEDSKHYFHAEIEAIDVSSDKSVERINGWVKDATNGKIDEIISAPLNSYLVTILINAIYFKGAWTHPFDEAATAEHPFQLEDGATTTIPLMRMKKELMYIDHDDFQAIRLPYGENEEMSMQIFLPKENVAISHFQKQFTNEAWKKWNKMFKVQEGTLMLPKFQQEYEATLNESLKSLGMRTAFIEGEANFEKMIEEDDPIWISEVKQKTFIDVNEEGTEAAGVTSVEIRTTSAPVDSFEMKVDRPFIMTIIDEETEMILFMGTIMNP